MLRYTVSLTNTWRGSIIFVMLLTVMKSMIGSTFLPVNLNLMQIFMLGLPCSLTNTLWWSSPRQKKSFSSARRGWRRWLLRIAPRRSLLKNSVKILHKMETLIVLVFSAPLKQRIYQRVGKLEGKIHHSPINTKRKKPTIFLNKIFSIWQILCIDRKWQLLSR